MKKCISLFLTLCLLLGAGCAVGKAEEGPGVEPCVHFNEHGNVNPLYKPGQDDESEEELLICRGYVAPGPGRKGCTGEFYCRLCNTLCIGNAEIPAEIGIDYAWAEDHLTVTASEYREDRTWVRETVGVTVTCTATCTQAGETVYETLPFEHPQFVCQKKTFPTAALGHAWEKPSYAWTDDLGFMTASRVCSRAAEHAETERVQTTAETLKEATCTQAGLIRYTSADFANEAFEKQSREQTVPAFGHAWGEPEFLWIGLTACEARFSCACGDDIQSKMAVITSEVTAEPGDTRTGIRTYTASVQFLGKEYRDTREESIPALFTIAGNMLTGYTGTASEITIPAGVTAIASGALLGTGLRKVTIGAWVTSIGEDAFPPGTEIDAQPDSYAFRWAGENGYSRTNEPESPASGEPPAEEEPPASEEPAVAEEPPVSMVPPAASPEPPAPSVTLSKAEIQIADQVYTGKALTPVVTVRLNGKKLVREQDYTVSWTDNRQIGKATVKVTGRNGYAGEKTATFLILPKGVSLSSLKAEGRKLTVRWKKAKGIDGYEVEVGLKKSFKGARKITLTGVSSVKTVIGKLKAGKTCYVRIRTWKKVKGKKYVSAWSEVRKIRMP